MSEPEPGSLGAGPVHSSRSIKVLRGGQSGGGVACFPTLPRSVTARFAPSGDNEG